MGNLFDLIPEGIQFPVANDDWRPEDPPSLDGIDEVFLNFETTGLKWFEGDRPLSISIWAGDRSYYLPWGHRGKGNLDEAVVKRWAQRELRGKLITNINTRFDIHMARVWGVDLEEQGNRVSDVAHYAALLDDHRKLMNLDALIKDFLGETPRVRLDESRMESYSAGSAQARSRYNVEAVRRLKLAMWPRLDAEKLQKVRQLEDEVIFVVCEMEKNGTLIDQELLEKWVKETEAQYHSCVMQLYKATGMKINPNSSKDEAKLFEHLRIPIIEFTASGQPSFTDMVIKGVDHPTIRLLRRAKKLSSLNSKFKKYQKAICSDGVMRYALHQLRAARSDASDSGETGTISGRFTSTEITSGIGINIQQVLKPEKQILTYGDEYFVRELHVPREGLFLRSDAKQVEYRLFANEIASPKILKAYEENPDLSFHKMIHKMLLPFKADLTYKRAKDCSFATIYGAGITKLAVMLEFISQKEFLELREQRASYSHPKLAAAVEIKKIYDREIPEAKLLLQRMSKLAETQGYVTTVLGRRMRFPDKQRLHKALNARIQGSAADALKAKLVFLHKQRKTSGFTLCFTVHDEVDGYVPNQEAADQIAKLMDHQDFTGFKVPILWDTKTGKNWADCSAEELAEIRADLQ